AALVGLERSLQPRAVQQARVEAEKSGRPLEAVLIERGLVSRAAFFEALGSAAGVPAFDLATGKIRFGDAQLVPRELAESKQLLPVDRRDGRLVVAMADPEDVFTRQQVSSLTGMEIDVRVLYPPDLPAALERAWSVKVERITSETPHGAAAAPL